jgi:hypothetical protein
MPPRPVRPSAYGLRHLPEQNALAAAWPWLLRTGAIAAGAVMLFGSGLEPLGLRKPPAGPMVLGQLAVAIEKIEVSLRRQLGVSSDACNPDEHLG